MWQTCTYVKIQEEKKTDDLLALKLNMQQPVMPLSHCEEYPCEYENLKFAANSPKMIRLAWRNTEKVRPYEFLRNSYESLRISANPLRIKQMGYDCFDIFLRMHWECVRTACQHLRVLANPWEWHTNIKIVLQMPSANSWWSQCEYCTFAPGCDARVAKMV